MARIICLANSTKSPGRCLAGIDVDTGAWIRPVSHFTHRAITPKTRIIEGKEPEILDVLDIPLEDCGPDEGCQPENRLVKPGLWQKIGRKHPEELLKHCEDDTVILHNHEECVPAEFFRNLPRKKWKSLQLIHNESVSFYQDYWHKYKWRAYFRDGKGYFLELPVKDPIFLEKLRRKKKVSNNCILTISLAGPWSRDEIIPKRCYKLVAGLIEL